MHRYSMQCSWLESVCKQNLLMAAPNKSVGSNISLQPIQPWPVSQPRTSSGMPGSSSVAIPPSPTAQATVAPTRPLRNGARAKLSNATLGLFYEALQGLRQVFRSLHNVLISPFSQVAVTMLVIMVPVIALAGQFASNDLTRKGNTVAEKSYKLQLWDDCHDRSVGVSSLNKLMVNT